MEILQGEVSRRTTWPWSTLRNAALAGMGARQVLADAIGQSDLTGAAAPPHLPYGPVAR